MLKRTPLYAAHQKLGARLIEFGGWEMPVQYTSIVDEHQAVRTAAGLFDISHMGEVTVRGRAAVDFLNGVLTNDARKLQTGHGQYTLMCNQRGGVIDDLYLYRIEPESFLLIINASRIEADVRWLEEQASVFSERAWVQLKNASDDFGAIAVQGPRVAQFINACFPSAVAEALPADLQKNQVLRLDVSRETALISRTGYTGEDGFEIVAPASSIEAIWNRVLETGRAYGLKPAGLGARDTLRTEVCYPLYGHELDENTTPIEAGLGFFVALNKGDFVGRSVLAAQKEKGPAKKLVAFQMTGKSPPPRADYEIWSAGHNGRAIGKVTSGMPSPTLGMGVGLGYVPPEFSSVNTPVEIQIRAARAPALIVSKPFYKRR